MSFRPEVCCCFPVFWAVTGSVNLSGKIHAEIDENQATFCKTKPLLISKTFTMKNKQLFQELASWQWEISGYQKAAFLIEERLDVIHKNDRDIPTETAKKIYSLQNQVIDQERELDELERVLVHQKESLRNYKDSAEWQSRMEKQQLSLRNRVNLEKSVFCSLKDDYNKVLSEMLLKIAS